MGGGGGEGKSGPRTGKKVRPRCDGCGELAAMCMCAALPRLGPLETPGLRIVVLQHPLEAKTKNNSINGALVRCIKDCQVVQGRKFDLEKDEKVAEALKDPCAILLYPGTNARPIREMLLENRQGNGDRASTLIVLDGTWSTTKAMLRDSPCLVDFQRRARIEPCDMLTAAPQFLTRVPPDRIAGAVSTAEAIAAALNVAHELANESKREAEKGSPAAIALISSLQLRVRLQLGFMGHQRHGSDEGRGGEPEPGASPAGKKQRTGV